MVNSYLHGNYAPVHDELDTGDLEVIGEVPSWLDGTFVRNGANPYFLPNGRHCRIDGDGMLHAVALRGGRARYRNRFVATEGLALERAAGRSLWNGFFERPNPDSPKGPPGSSIFKNTANTSVVAHAGAVLAMYEGGLPHRVDPATLETHGLHDFDGTWEGVFIAHPKIDTRTGEMMFISCHIPTAHVRYGVVGPDGRVVHHAPVKTDIGMVMHDMAITERFTVVFALPYTFDRGRIAAGRPPFEFERDRPSRFGIIARHGTDVRWFEASPCYIFHTLNAYEDGDEVVLRAPRLEYTEWLHRSRPFGMQPWEKRGGDWAGPMHEWRFNLRTGETRERMIDELVVDFPQLPPDLVARRHRHAYAVRVADQAGGEPIAFDAIVKYDLERGATEIAPFGPERFGHECAVVPRPGAEGEDDAALLTYVHDEFHGKSELVIYPARSPAKGPIARVLLPRRVPYGFHGTWLPSR